jgi:predicted kinase
MKYEQLGQYLDMQSRPEVILAFSEVEAILGSSLPPSAYKYPAWWANEDSPLTIHSQCSAWMAVGYRAFANVPAGEVRFVRKPVAFKPNVQSFLAPFGIEMSDERMSSSADTASAPTLGGPLLLVFGGLPGTGKTTVARKVASDCGATYLRIDEIEQAIRSANGISGDVGVVGYTIAYAMAEANLRLGRIVIADCVNPVAATRRTWRATAASANARIFEVEMICSDPIEHRRRIENRTSDIPGFVLPNWTAVRSRTYELWPWPHLVIDSAKLSADGAAEHIQGALRVAAGNASA